LVGRFVIERAIEEGVRIGLFGLGELSGEQTICRYFKEEPTLSFSGSEILLSEKVCSAQKQRENLHQPPGKPEEPARIGKATPPGVTGVMPEIPESEKKHVALLLNFILPKGKVASLMGVMNYLQSKYEVLKLEINAMHGEITEREYEEKILEALRQAGIELKE
ncbi:MAG: AAA family ATPase, partial [Spirochaetota bacterium]